MAGDTHRWQVGGRIVEWMVGGLREGWKNGWKDGWVN